MDTNRREKRGTQNARKFRLRTPLSLISAEPFVSIRGPVFHLRQSAFVGGWFFPPDYNLSSASRLIRPFFCEGTVSAGEWFRISRLILETLAAKGIEVSTDIGGGNFLFELGGDDYSP
jgi:hypothetical protein